VASPSEWVAIPAVPAALAITLAILRLAVKVMSGTAAENAGLRQELRDARAELREMADHYDRRVHALEVELARLRDQ
jgi:hypothetical protein